MERWNRFHPAETPRIPLVTGLLVDAPGIVVTVTDYMRLVPDQISRWVPRPYTSLETDGYGRSDTRAALRGFFETDAGNVVVATLSALAHEGRIDPGTVKDAVERYDIDADAADPWTR